MVDSPSRQVVNLRPRPLSAEAFAPFGKVLDREQFVMTSTEFPFFTNVATLRPPDEPIPYINRHHDHNQIFASFGEPMIVVVARPELSASELSTENIQAFVTDGTQAFVFHIDTWHLEPRAHGTQPIRALNVQATNNRVHTERVELEPTFGFVIQLDVPRKSQLDEKIASSWARLQSLVDGKDEDGLQAPLANGWSIKDHLAHVAAWEKVLIARLERQDFYAAIGVSRAEVKAVEASTGGSRVDAINAVVQRQSHDRSLADVLADARATHARALAALAPLTDFDLLRTNRTFVPNAPSDDAIVEWILGNTAHHYDEHSEWIEKG
ncbi:MAG TPA: ClbS/DfsB family four-helix bundle protein [Chloroflexota bacterium]|nr:ClbS/DfsB family four-helix bundle protein [Chloroflexota bacterium]